MNKWKQAATYIYEADAAHNLCLNVDTKTNVDFTWYVLSYQLVPQGPSIPCKFSCVYFACSAGRSLEVSDKPTCYHIFLLPWSQIILNS